MYFVRHGETILNRKLIHQTPSTTLSPLGREQAVTVAEYLRPMNPDILLTSEYARALETARIIGMMLDLAPRTSGLFYEVERPSKLAGRSLFTPETIWYVLRSVQKQKDPKWRYYDAENFNDVYTRVQRALHHIESLKDAGHKSVVVVSHTIFINLMIAYMCHDRILAIRDLLPSFLNVKKMNNCGVVEIEYVEKRAPNTCAWQMVMRDDKVAG